MSGAGEPWALRLFRRSVIKQEKWRRIAELLPPLAGRECLDVGADNGVVSHLLRRRGGRWTSADLDERTVNAIRELVGERVVRLTDGPAPFAAGAFDLIVIVDYLEHIADDAGFARDCARMLKPGATLIVNVPHHKPGSLMDRLRHAVGLTDEWHGHLRPGYTVAGLRALLGADFELERARTYSRAFSELVDIAINTVVERRHMGGSGGAKGSVVTGGEVARRRKAFAALSLVYPLLWLFVRLDALLVGQSGWRLVARFRRAG